MTKFVIFLAKNIVGKDIVGKDGRGEQFSKPRRVPKGKKGTEFYSVPLEINA